MNACNSTAVDRHALADHLLAKLRLEETRLRALYHEPNRIPFFYVDDVLPEDVAKLIYSAFPPIEQMVLKCSWREHKYIGVQMDAYAPFLEEALFSFQDKAVVEFIGEITGIRELEPDPQLYAGGVSAMVRGQFLSPHIDNSHDGKQRNYRALNLLYYVTPEWSESDGGNLQLWEKGMADHPRTIPARFNRLVVMRTDQTALHSVSPVSSTKKRCCVSNYYFSPLSPNGTNYRHATSFRAWPGRPLLDLALRIDGSVKSLLLNTILKGRYRNPHTYRTKAKSEI
jgi:Rps23 Pro-64 3,4-dihydroxylase Tpa1-like proline 4-hydroxylase